MLSAKAKKYTCWGAQFFLGGLSYGALEILWRGYTHISMALVGGVCFWLLVRISKTKYNPAAKCLVGGLAITGVEFFIGCVVNLWLKLNVWDYSMEPCHFLGQVCVRFFLLWCALCAVLLPICRYACSRRFTQVFHRSSEPCEKPSEQLMPEGLTQE